MTPAVSPPSYAVIALLAKGALPLWKPLTDPTGTMALLKFPNSSDSFNDPNQPRDLKKLEAILKPILPAAKPQTEMLSCRVSREKNQALKHWCEERGISFSDYVRSQLYDEPLPLIRPRQKPAALDRQVLIELNRIGSNLNQAVRRLHRHPMPTLTMNDRALLNQLLQTLAEIKEKLAQ